MSDSAFVESTEELREALLSLRQDHDRLAERSLYAQQLLEALDALLVESDEDPFERVFEALRRTFTFRQALILVADEDDATSATLECIVADPLDLLGSRWPIGPVFRKVMTGRVVTTVSSEATEEWRGEHIGLLSRAQSALYVPVRVRERWGILVLLRPGGADGFVRAHVALAKRFSVLVSHALATRFATQTAAEKGALRELTAQLRRSEHTAKRNLNLLNEVIDVLPVGVTVQDEQGRVQIVNGAAAHALGCEPADLIGKPAGLLFAAADDELRGGDRFARMLERGGQRAYEHDMRIDGEPRTLLVTDKPVRIFNESLLLSTTLDITERKRFEEELSRQAFYDQLTGLPNQTLIHKIVERTIEARESEGLFGLAFVDLDNFKQVNDYYSHAVGDALLKAVSERIGASIREGDMLARISGDEFLLLIDPLDGCERLSPLIQRITEALKEPFVIEGHEILTSASVGASAFPLHGRDYETLRRCADNAMYQAKNDGKGTVQYFDAATSPTLTARMELEQRVRTALREGHFRAAYQAKVDIHTGCVHGFEALCRWVEPEGAVHLPGAFIELAAELGLLDAITHIMLEDVIGSLPAIESAFGPDVSISLNISAKQAGDVAFMDSIVHRLGSPRIAPRIVLELTEDALVVTQRFQNHVLPKLRQLGVRVSIDDFGTGYSSLSTLADITADEVKVDRAFITEIHERPRSQGLLRAIESLCSALDIEVVAEGVETLAELDYLRADTSIPSVQGFYFHRPQLLDALLTQSENGISAMSRCA